MAHVVVITKGHLRMELDGRTEISVEDEGEMRCVRMTREQMRQLVEAFYPMERERVLAEELHAKLMRGGLR